MSFLNVRVRSWGVMVMVDVFARFGDELFGQFWNGTSNNENSSSFAVDCTDEKINWLTAKVGKIDLGGATMAESRKRLNDGYSIIAGVSQGTGIAPIFVEIISKATPNLMI